MILDRVDLVAGPVNIKKSDVVDTSFADSVIAGSVGAQDFGFYLRVRNIHGSTVSVLWPEARYVDELGTSHTVYHYGQQPPPEDVNRASPPSELGPGASLVEIVAPAYKTYMGVVGCKSYFAFQEPLLPSMLRGKTETQVRAYLESVVRNRAQVRLLLPIEVDGMRRDYILTWLLSALRTPGAPQ